VRRAVVATPLYAERLRAFLDGYAARGAVRLVDRFSVSHEAMLANLAEFEELAPARRRTVRGRSVTVREYLLDAGAREFLVLFWVPPGEADPIVLLNLRIGGQNRYRWPRGG
jgi:hypothetical protein